MLIWYEKPADQSEAVQVKRAGYGEGYYKKYEYDYASTEWCEPVSDEEYGKLR